MTVIELIEILMQANPKDKVCIDSQNWMKVIELEEEHVNIDSKNSFPVRIDLTQEIELREEK